jgi:hypothetical protein
MKYMVKFLFLLGATLVLTACNDDKPGKEAIKQVLVQALPGYYSIDDILIIAQANAGTSVEPLYQSRFTVTVSPREPLYARADPVEGIAMVRVVRKAGEAIKLYGLATSSHQGEGWKTALQFEQSLPAGLPISNFGNGVHVLGSQDAQDAVDKVLAERAARENAVREKFVALRNALTGAWKGQYVCGQNEAGADVSISDVSDTGNIRGSFHFYPLPGRKNVADGEFALVGSVNAESGMLVTQPGGWIRQPPGYSAVGFQAPVTPTMTALEGRLTAFGCSTITLRKAS